MGTALRWYDGRIQILAGCYRRKHEKRAFSISKIKNQASSQDYYYYDGEISNFYNIRRGHLFNIANKYATGFYRRQVERKGTSRAWPPRLEIKSQGGKLNLSRTIPSISSLGIGHREKTLKAATRT